MSMMWRGAPNEFLGWWCSQLSRLRLERIFGFLESTDAIVAEPSSDEVIVIRQRKRGFETVVSRIQSGEMVATGRHGAKGQSLKTSTTLLVEANHLLQRDMMLPLATQNHLPAVLRYELERQISFEPSEVAWTYSVIRRDHARKRIYLSLEFVVLSEVARSIALLGKFGHEVTRIEVATKSRVVALTLNGPKLTAREHHRTALVAAASVYALALLTPFVVQQIQLDRLRAADTALTPLVSKALVDQKSIRRAFSGDSEVDAEIHRSCDPLNTLAALANQLPDDTYVTEVYMQACKLTLNGASGSAPSVIERLSTGSDIQDAKFTAPTLRRESEPIDTFSVSATVRP